MSQNIVNALGAGSGIDTQALVKGLVDVERLAPQARIDNNRETFEAQISDFGLLSSALSVLQDASKLLGNSDTFNSKSAALPESTAFNAISLDPATQAGDYSIEIDQLAQAQSLSSSAVFDSSSSEVGQGTLTFDFGRWDVVTPPADPSTFTAGGEKASVTITIDSSNNTLAGLSRAINDADFGVQATIINDGSGDRLVVRAESGLDNQLQITAVESGVSPTNTDDSGLSRFAFNASAFQLNQNQIGQDAQLSVNGLDVTRTSNTIDDVIDGFEFSLSGETPEGQPVNISIEEDRAAGEQAVRDFFTAYNTFLEVLEPITGFNEETESFGSLSNDALAKSIPNQIRQLLVGNVEGLDSGFTALTNVGIRTELDGTLSIDEDDFSDAIDNNYDLFKNLFVEVRDSSTDQITVNSTGKNTTEGQYEVVITQQPTKGNVTGADSADDILANLAAAESPDSTLIGSAPAAVLSDFVATSGNFTAGASTVPLDLQTQAANADDYDFTITVDGVAAAAVISLPVADYADNDAIATALQTAINNDDNISGVTVTFDTDHFVFSPSSDGAASNIALAAVGPNADELGISTGATNNGTGGANDYDFSIEVDGTTSGTISVTPGSYANFDDLATHLTAQINADATLTGAGATVTVTHDGANFVVSSDSTGSVSYATAIGSEATDLGLSSVYDFTIAVNGTSSGVISLTSQTYADKNELATEIETQINQDSLLLASGAAVDVSYDSDNDSFIIESRLFGANSTISVTNVGGSASDLGLSSGTATTGINVAGTVDGVEAFGIGNVLLPALGEPSESLGLIIGENATSGTVNFSRGFGGQLERLIEQFLDNTGVIESREVSLNSDVEELDTDQIDLDRRIEAYQERLTSQFIAMEAIVRSLQDSGSFLETTLDSLLNAGRDS